MDEQKLDKLAEALAKAQGEIVTAWKDKTNTHLTSNYATLASIWSACRVPLAKNGLAVIQPISFGAGAVTVQTILIHSSGQQISCSLSLPVGSQKGLNDCQVIGSAITYGRKYGLSAMVGIAPVDGDDDDGNSTGDGGSPPPSPPPEPKPPKTEPYTDEIFNELLERARVQVSTKAKTVDDIISMASARRALTQEQIQAIRKLGKSGEGE